MTSVQFSSVTQSCPTLQPHELQHARPACPSPTPRVHSNSRPLSQWCHPAISSSVVPFSSCPQSLPASESFPMRQLFIWLKSLLIYSLNPPFSPQLLACWISYSHDPVDCLLMVLFNFFLDACVSPNPAIRPIGLNTLRFTDACVCWGGGCLPEYLLGGAAQLLMYMMPCNHLWLVSWLRCCHSDSSIIKFPIKLSPSEVVGPQPWLRIWSHLGTFTVNSEVLTYLVWSAAYTVRLFFFFLVFIWLRWVLVAAIGIFAVAWGI